MCCIALKCELFLLIGIDAFADIAQWHQPEALLRECEFIVASRPGYSLRSVAESLPEGLRPSAIVTRPFQKQPAKGDLVLPRVTLHLLDDVNQSVSATAIRTAAAQSKPLTRWVDASVAVGDQPGHRLGAQDAVYAPPGAT